jgi:hypothetical protein
MRPGSGECYGFKRPPILGGGFTVENTAILPIHDYLACSGSIHQQLQNVPDGTEVQIEITNLPPKA